MMYNHIEGPGRSEITWQLLVSAFLIMVVVLLLTAI